MTNNTLGLEYFMRNTSCVPMSLINMFMYSISTTQVYIFFVIFGFSISQSLTDRNTVNVNIWLSIIFGVEAKSDIRYIKYISKCNA